MRKRALFSAIVLILAACMWKTPFLMQQEENNLSIKQGPANECTLLSAGVASHFLDFQFLDEHNGWGITEYSLWKTSDGGRTWAELSRASAVDTKQMQSLPILEQVQFLTPEDGWLLEQDHLLHTTDGGISWRKHGFKNVVIRSFRFLDINNGWFVGDELVYHPDKNVFTSHPIIHATMDGGETWSRKYRGPDSPYPLWSVWPISLKNIWAVGVVIIKSNDGGETWNEVSTLKNQAGGMPIEIEFLDSDIGWMKINETEGSYLITKDGGNTWTLFPTSVNPSGFLDIAFVSPTEAWGISGNVPGVTSLYMTKDGGLSWEQRLTGEYHSVFYLENKGAFYVAGKGMAKCEVR